MCLRTSGGGGTGEVGGGEGGVTVWLVHHANTAHHVPTPLEQQVFCSRVEIFTFSFQPPIPLILLGVTKKRRTFIS